jgi:hypothetical protein
MSIRPTNAHFDPSLFVVVRLIGHELETHLFSVKGERFVLVPSWNADEFDVSNQWRCPPKSI